MIPGMNPRQLQQMMRQMGMSQDELEVSEVIIKTKSGKNLIFSNPNVQKVTMQGQTTFQVIGNYEEQEEVLKVEISDEDVEMVASEANVAKDEAREALKKANGDIAEAIVNLSN